MGCNWRMWALSAPAKGARWRLCSGSTARYYRDLSRLKILVCIVIQTCDARCDECGLEGVSAAEAEGFCRWHSASCVGNHVEVLQTVQRVVSSNSKLWCKKSSWSHRERKYRLRLCCNESVLRFANLRDVQRWRIRHVKKRRIFWSWHQKSNQEV